MGAVVSTCSATSSLSFWLPWLLARLLCLWSLATSPDLSLALLLPLPGGLHRLPTLASLLIMWAREKQLRCPLVFLQLSALTTHSALLSLLDTLLVCLLLPALDIPTARMRRPRITTTCHS